MSKDDKNSYDANEARELVHELEVHQHELLMQNEELRKSELNLEEARDRYFDLFDLAPVAYLTVNRDGEIIEANFATALLLGCGRAELLGQRLSRFIVPELASEFQLFRQKLHDTGARAACELRCRRSAGSSFPVRMQGVAPRGRDNKIGARASIAIVDLSEITRAEQELQRSEDRLASFMNATNECVLVLSEDGTITEVNPSTLALLGVTEDAVVGRYIGSLDHDVAPALGAGVESSEVVWNDLDGEAHRMRLSVSPIRSASATTEYLCTAQDVTAQKNAQEKLRLSERLLRQIAETIEDGFYLREYASHEFSYVSPACESIFGHSCEEFYQRSEQMMEVVHSEDVAALAAARGSFERGDPFDEEYRIVRPDGEVRWMRERAFLVEGADGEIERIAGIVQDVTEQRQIDLELRQGQKMEAIGQLASGVAHDFNNILMGIHGCASIGLSKLEEASEVQPFLEAIRQSSESGTAIIKQLLAFSSNRRLEVATFDLRELVADNETMLTRLLGDGVQLEISQSKQACPVRLGTGQVEQVLMNLAINARDAMPDGGTLSIETDRGHQIVSGDGRIASGPCVILRIRDTGVGMSEQVRERIFEPFFTTKGIGEGTGLGLSTVYGIVNDAGGSLRCESKEGAGTTFIVRLPLVEAADSALEVDAVSPSFDSSMVEGNRVLLVEDESTVRMATRLYLESAGFDVIESGNGLDAADLLNVEGFSVDVLVTDVGLPGLGGAALAKKARAVNPSLPVVFMSAHPEDWLIEKGRLPYGELTLQKPFSKGELLHKVGAALEVSDASQS